MKNKLFLLAVCLICCLPSIRVAESIDFGDKTSETLTGKAWEALRTKDFKAAIAYTDKCVKDFENKAQEQQSALQTFPSRDKAFDYWALNDIGTSLFIKAMALKEEGKTDEATVHLKTIITSYRYAQCYDDKGKTFWKVAEAAEDQIVVMEQGLDFGNYTSEDLTGKAWQSFGTDDHDATIVYCRKCIKLYQKKADEQQAELKGYAPKDKAFDYWALNDVGTCYFIMGEVYLKKNEPQKALETYKTLVDKYIYAQCWDPKGWFWKPAVAARGKMNKIAAETGMMY